MPVFRGVSNMVLIVALNCRKDLDRKIEGVTL